LARPDGTVRHALQLQRPGDAGHHQTRSGNCLSRWQARRHALPCRVRFRVMWRPEEIKVLPQTRRSASNPALRIKPGAAH